MTTSIFLALIGSLAIEAPFMNLEKLMFKSSSQSKETRREENENPSAYENLNYVETEITETVKL